MKFAYKDTPEFLTDNYSALAPQQKIIVNRHMNFLKAHNYPAIDDDVVSERIRQTVSSPQGIRVLSEVIAATQAWKNDNSIALPKAIKLPKDKNDRNLLLLKRHKAMLKAAEPSIEQSALTNSFLNANTPEALLVLEQVEFFRQCSEMDLVKPAVKHSTKPTEKAVTTR
jgi:hypothetical protein